MTAIETHEFANGLKVNRARLLDLQLARYTSEGASNLHEPEEEHWFDHVLGLSPADGVFLDVGAAIGYYSTLVRLEKPKWQIYAMEPQQEMREALLETFKINGLPGDSLTLDEQALSAQTGQQRFRHIHYGSGLLTEQAAQTHPESTVPTVPLETVLDRIGRPVTLAKIDIQGAELSVLQAAGAALKSGRIDWIILGTHGADLHSACLAVLQESYEIVHQDGAPPEQPDGLIVARFRRGKDG
jgi:FkbM family methyltransferase